LLVQKLDKEIWQQSPQCSWTSSLEQPADGRHTAGSHFRQSP